MRGTEGAIAKNNWRECLFSVQAVTISIVATMAMASCTTTSRHLPSTKQTCGNGVIDPDESCDGQNLGGQNCRSMGFRGGSISCSESCELDISECTGSATCGDGVLDPGEDCDCGSSQDTMPTTCTDPNSDKPDAECRTNCIRPRCGDGIVDSRSGEECDDGNLNNSDACPDGPGGTCQPAKCGDGLVWTNHEECDDGNTINGDGCNSDCRVEACGNGVLDVGEGCDDGNTLSGDGCNSDCQVEACGNGVLDVGEGCDDGNHDNSDSCPDDAASGGTCQPAKCGDGLVWTNHEECDDGNNIDGDGCDASCMIEN